MKAKIHYHTHAAFFSGAENMVALFLQSDELQSKFSLSFSYRYSKNYHQGLSKRVINFKGKSYPLRFIHFYSYEQLPKLMPILFKRIIFLILNFLLTYPLLIYEIIVIRRLLMKITPDILHINNAGYPAALSARAAAIAGLISGVPKIIMVVNNMAAGYGHYSRWIDYPIDRLVVKSVSTFITGSQAAAERLQTVLKLPTHQLKTIHNGITLRNLTCSVAEIKQRLGLGEFKGVIFGVVALLIPRKGHQILLDAVLKLTSDKKLLGHEFMILIEGSGPLHPALVNFVTINKLSPWVKFVGDEANIVDFMSALDVLILPSVQDEDFPNVILEAMALGKPVIASRLAGTPEQVVEGVTGLLVESCNVSQLASAIYQIINQPGMRSSMGSASLARFNVNFNSPIALNKYKNLYTKLIQDEP